MSAESTTTTTSPPRVPTAAAVEAWLQAHYDLPGLATARGPPQGAPQGTGTVAVALLDGGVTTNVNCRVDVRPPPPPAAPSHPAPAPRQRFLLKVCREKTGSALHAWGTTMAARHGPMRRGSLQLSGVEVLRRHGYRTSYVVAGRDGALSYPLPDGREAALFDFLDGRPPLRSELTPAMLVQVGEALAGLHAVPLPADGRVPGAAHGGCATFCLYPDLLDALDARGLDEDRAMAALLRESCARLPNPLDPTDGRQALLHTDVFPDNTMFTENGRLVALIDFEEICTGPRLLDVAIALAGCCYEYTEDDAVLQPDLARALVRGYEAAAGPLPHGERAQFGLYLELAAVILVFWRYRQFNVRLAATTSPEPTRLYREMLSLLTAIVRAEGRPLVPGHAALVEMRPGRPSPDGGPRPIASVLWPAADTDGEVD